MALEIERKFLLPEYPEQLINDGEIKIMTSQNIDQTYLAIDGGQELRVRKITDLDSGEVTYTHTFKDGKGISREEIEYFISEGLYNQMIEAVNAVPLIKKRLTGIWNGTTIEIDVYNQLELSVLEVEFDSLEEAESFNAPEWFGEDVSTERKYSNKTVWKELQDKSSHI
ncbi:MAG: CYTH domain-containing protein [Paenibacillus sp.]|nr:CYTH domain-containing protein [Paenibacillus sp.]